MSSPLVRYLAAVHDIPVLTAADAVVLAKRIEAGMYADEIVRSTIPAPTALSLRRRGDLVTVARDGRVAWDRMIRANLRLVVAIASRYVATGPVLLDVIQEGNLGLVHAVAGFDHTKGYPFSTYATWWIRRSIERFLGTASCLAPIPIDLADVLVDPAPPVTEVAERHDRARRVRATVARLPAVTAQVISLRYGLADGRTWTRQEVADRMALTRCQVATLERNGLARLRGLELGSG